MKDYYRDTKGQFVENPAKRSQEVLRELYRAFDYFNEHLAKGSLPKVVITIQEAGRRNALGWFGKGFWSDQICEDGVSEINLSAEYMSRKPEEILETLIHEMAHLKNACDGIRDCTSGQYHNKHFKRTAEEFGLLVERSGNKGYAYTSIGEKAEKAIKAFNPNTKILSSLKRKRVAAVREKRYVSLIVGIEYEELIERGIDETGLSQKEFVEQAIATAVKSPELILR